MVKRKIVPIILSATILSAIIGNMVISNATDNNLKTFEYEKTVKVNQIEDCKKELEKEINKYWAYRRYYIYNTRYILNI